MESLMGLGGNETSFVFIATVCVVLFSGILFVIPLWQIAKKTGISPLISLLAFVPVVGLTLALFIFGFSPNKKGR